MRILLVHNFYGSAAPSGENQVFEAEKAMLEKHGEDVAVFTRHSDEIRGGRGFAGRAWGLAKGALCTVGNPFAARALAKKIREFKPDVVHFHNQFPLISPLAIRAAHKCGAKVVMTLHNYRTVCAAGVPTRCGKACRECFQCCASGTARLTVSPALRHRCYRGSRLATLPLAVNVWLYRSRWVKWVDRFIVLSEFQKARMAECGFPAEKIAVKGNFVKPSERDGEDVEKRNQILYVGRLGKEKGVDVLVRAFGALRGSAVGGGETKLILMGDGDGRAELETLAQGMGIVFKGKRPHDEVVAEMARSKAVVVPSVCWETFGLTAVEAMSVGTPAVVSDVGALPDLTDGGKCGEIFEAGDAEALAAAIGRLLSREDYADVCAACRRRVAERYSEAANFRQLREIYANLVGDK